MPKLSELIAESGASAPAAFDKTSPVWTSVSGQVVSVLVRQRRNAKMQPQWWDADPETGERRPQQQVVITIETGVDSDPDEAGVVSTERSLFLKTWGPNWRAFATAVKSAGYDDLPVGSFLAATYTGESDEKVEKGMNAAKLYAFQVAPAGTSSRVSPATVA